MEVIYDGELYDKHPFLKYEVLNENYLNFAECRDMQIIFQAHRSIF